MKLLKGRVYWGGEFARTLAASYPYEQTEPYLREVLDACWKWGGNYPDISAAGAPEAAWPSQTAIDAIKKNYPHQFQPFMVQQLTGLERLLDRQILVEANPDWSLAKGIEPAIRQVVEAANHAPEVVSALGQEAQRLEGLAQVLQARHDAQAKQADLKGSESESIPTEEEEQFRLTEWKASELKEIADAMRRQAEAIERSATLDSD
ncbi:hypothetical protein KQI84_19100 [bacterium]|nr:hypothetical protein [bacterium]